MVFLRAKTSEYLQNIVTCGRHEGGGEKVVRVATDVCGNGKYVQVGEGLCVEKRVREKRRMGNGFPYEKTKS